MHGDRHRKRLAKFRKGLKRTDLYGDLADVHRRLVEVAEELRRATDRTRIQALEAERKCLGQIGELLAAGDLVVELKNAVASNRALEARLSQREILRADKAPPFVIVGEEVQ